MVPFDTIQRAASGLCLVLVLLCAGTTVAHAQDLRTQNLLLDDDAPTSGTRNTITLRAPGDATLTSDYVLRFPDGTGLGAGSILFIQDYTAPVATADWLLSSPSSLLTTDASGQLVWESISTLLGSPDREWNDGDSIGMAGLIYARQALENGSADTVVITDAGSLGIGTSTPDAWLTIRGSSDLLSAYDAGGTLRSVLNDDGQQDWFLGTFTGEVGQARVGTTSGFPSFTLFRPGSTDRFDILNRSQYTAFGYNADGSDTGSTFNIAQGGNVGIGTASPASKLHVTSASDPLRLDGLVQDNTLDSLLVVDGNGVVHWMPAGNLTPGIVDSIESNAWLLTGNTGTVDGTNFLGTTDSIPLNFRVNNSRAFRIEPTAADPNIIGGLSANSVSTGVVGTTIGGGTSNTNISGNYAVVAGGSGNSLTADYGAIGGGRDNTVSGTDATVGGGQLNTASGSDATVGGGEDNVASGDISTVSGGDENSASGYAATVAGGESGLASGNYASIGGGEDNLAAGHYSTVGGGWQDTASGYASAIAGGEGNTASGSRAAVGGGQLNTASGSRSVVGGGENNVASEGYTTVSGGWNDTASGYASAIGGGEYNVVSGSRGTVSGGGENRVSGNYSGIGGGMGNTISGVFSVIPGGRGLTVNGAGTFGFLGDNDAGANNMTVTDEDIAVFGNTDLWLANNNGGASALRFYESNSSTGTFPGAANYSSFEARAQSGDLRYLLPDTAGIVGDVLGVSSVAGTIITLDWQAGSGGSSGDAWLLTGNSGTNPSTNFLGTTDNVGFEIRVNNSRALRIDPRTASPNITGGFNGNSISTSDDGNVIAGGGVSGATNQLGSGVDYSFVGGGVGNQMYSNSSYAVIGGGQNNRLTSTSNHSAILGGNNIQLDNSQYSVVGGGNNNSMNSGSFYSGILGGNNNQLSNADYSFIGSGNNNQMNSASDYSALVGGNNQQISGSDYAFLGSGSNNQLNSTSDYSLLVGGSGNQVTGSRYSGIVGGLNILVGSGSDYSFAGGGQANQVNSSDWAAIVSGSNNQVGSGSDYAFIGAGSSNRATSNADYSAVIAGLNNQIDNSQNAFIGSGNNNRLSSTSTYGAIVSGANNQIDGGQYSLIGSGNNNRLTSTSFYSAIVSGANSQIDNGDYSYIGGGSTNTMTNSTNYAVLGGGESNVMNGAEHSVLTGGRSNSVSGDFSALGGGQSNTISGNYSAVPGGRGLTLSGTGSFGFLGNNSAGGNNMTVADNNVTVLGNTDIWLANNDNSASQLRMYEPNSSTGTFPGGVNYSSLRAQAQAQDIEYIFPDTAGIVGDVLVVKNQTGTQVTLDWATTNETSSVGRLIFARKTANESASTVSLQNDDHLSLALEANKTYEISGALYVKQTGGAGNPALDIAWTVPGGTGTGASNSTMLISYFANESKSGNSNTGADYRDRSGFGATSTGSTHSKINLSTNMVVVHFKGLVLTGTTSGNIVLQWTPDSNSTITVYQNSYMGAKVAEN